MLKFDNHSRQLYFELGLCSLEEYSEKYKEKYEIISIENVLYIFKTGIIFIYEFMKNALCHGDIKPANMQIKLNKTNMKKVLRMIDLGGSNSLLIPTEYTEDYYLSPFIT